MPQAVDSQTFTITPLEAGQAPSSATPSAGSSGSSGSPATAPVVQIVAVSVGVVG